MVKPLTHGLRLGIILAAITIHAGASGDTRVLETRLLGACQDFRQAPTAEASRQLLLDASRQMTNAPLARALAMAAYSLTLLMQGNTNAFELAQRSIATVSPDVANRIAVKSSDAYAVCPVCQGTGRETLVCPTCKGTGTCTACKGSGVRLGQPCPVCKGRKVCPACEGAKTVTPVCHQCLGTGRIFKLSPQIAENFNALIESLTTVCRDDLTFADTFVSVRRERDDAKRFARLQDLALAFQHRTDLLAPVQADLAALQKLLRAREEKRLAALMREEETRKRNEILKLKDAPDLTNAIALVSAYLADHRNEAESGEIQALLDELCAKRKHERQLRVTLYGVAFAFAALAIIGALKAWFGRKKTEGYHVPPGLDKIDKDEFTDPLTLNAKESQQRAREHKP